MNSQEIFTYAEGVFLSYGLLIVFVSSFIEISPVGWIIPGGTILAIGGFFSYGKTVSLLGTVIFGWFGAWAYFHSRILSGKRHRKTIDRLF
jgi:membrane protein DedA with SNARE-associated domain